MDVGIFRFELDIFFFGFGQLLELLHTCTVRGLRITSLHSSQIIELASCHTLTRRVLAVMLSRYIRP